MKATIFASCHLDDDENPNLPTHHKKSFGSRDVNLRCKLYGILFTYDRLAIMCGLAEFTKGGIAWIAQSGSAFSAYQIMTDGQGLLAVSTGMELVTTVVDYIDWALCHPETRVIGFLLRQYMILQVSCVYLKCTSASYSVGIKGRPYKEKCSDGGVTYWCISRQ